MECIAAINYGLDAAKVELKSEPSYNLVRGVEDTLNGRCSREGDRFMSKQMIKEMPERATYEVRKAVKSVRSTGVKDVNDIIENWGAEIHKIAVEVSKNSVSNVVLVEEKLGQMKRDVQRSVVNDNEFMSSLAYQIQSRCSPFFSLLI